MKFKGCDVCASSCPARAIDIKYHRDVQFIEEIKDICSTKLEYKEDYVDTIELINKKLNTLASQ